MAEQNNPATGQENNVLGSLGAMADFVGEKIGMGKIGSLVTDIGTLQANPAFAALSDKIATNPTLADAIASVTGVDAALLQTGGTGISVDTITAFSKLSGEQVSQLHHAVKEINADPTILETLNNMPPQMMESLVRKGQILMENEDLQGLKSMIERDPDMANLVESVTGIDLAGGAIGPDFVLDILRRGPEESPQQAVERIEGLNNQLGMATSPETLRMISYGHQMMNKFPQLTGAMSSFAGAFSGFSNDGLGKVFEGGGLNFGAMGIDFGKIFEALASMLGAVTSMFNDPQRMGGLLQDGLGMVKGELQGAITGEKPVMAGNLDFGTMLTKALGLEDPAMYNENGQPKPQANADHQPRQNGQMQGPGSEPVLAPPL